MSSEMSQPIVGRRSEANGTPATGATDPISQILKTSRTVAVVGLSSRPHRPSYGVAQYLQSAGYRVIPVNPGETEVLGEKSYARLEEVPERVDIVNIFRDQRRCQRSWRRRYRSVRARFGCKKV